MSRLFAISVHIFVIRSPLFHDHFIVKLPENNSTEKLWIIFLDKREWNWHKSVLIYVFGSAVYVSVVTFIKRNWSAVDDFGVAQFKQQVSKHTYEIILQSPKIVFNHFASVFSCSSAVDECGVAQFKQQSKWDVSEITHKSHKIIWIKLLAN